MHLDVETIERFIHNELSARDRARVGHHVAGCPICQEELNRAQDDDRLVFDLISEWRVPVPPVGADAIVEQGRRRRNPRWSRWAAALVLTAAGAGAAYAAPGSPIAEWLGGAFGGDSGAVESRLPEGPQDESVASGIMVDADREWTIHFPDAYVGGVIRVNVADGPGITIESSLEGASFDSDVDRVTVRQANEPRADFRVNVPPSAPSVEIFVGARSVWRSHEGRIIATSMDETGHGSYRLLLPVDPNLEP